MKRFFAWILILCGLLTSVSCSKDNPNTDILGASSYWKSEMSNSDNFYLGFVLLPEDKQIFGTYLYMAETEGGDSVTGNVNIEGNTITVTASFSVGRFPDTYIISGNVITCRYNDEELTFYKITEQEFFDSVKTFEKE